MTLGTSRSYTNTKFFIGLDLGQSRDFTALAVVERAEVPGAWDAFTLSRPMETKLSLRYLERVPLGTPYPEIVERVSRMVHSQELAGRCDLIVDATGVGRPVVDMLSRAGLGCTMRAVLVTEMAEMRVKLTPSGNEQFGVWREGQHDDLVFAVALGCWGVEKGRPHDMVGRFRLF